MGTVPIICRGCKKSNTVKPTINTQPSSKEANLKDYSPGYKRRPAPTKLADLIISEFDAVGLTSEKLPVSRKYNGTDQDFIPRQLSRQNAQFLCKYDLQNVIGKGSFSEVLRVKHKETNELFALKIINKDNSCGYKTSNNERELMILKRTKHPSIVTLYEVFEAPDKMYLVLDLAMGGDLFERLSTKGHFNETLASSTIAMVTSGLAYLHGLGITHRDLKLENLLYKFPGDKSQVMISDFGLGHICDEKNKPVGLWTTCGSAEYLSPEMLDGDMYTNVIDSWALGVITYAVLCGTMPFISPNRAILLRMIKSGDYAFTDEVQIIIFPSSFYYGVDK